MNFNRLTGRVNSVSVKSKRIKVLLLNMVKKTEPITAASKEGRPKTNTIFQLTERFNADLKAELTKWTKPVSAIANSGG